MIDVDELLDLRSKMVNRRVHAPSVLARKDKGSGCGSAFWAPDKKHIRSMIWSWHRSEKKRFENTDKAIDEQKSGSADMIRSHLQQTADRLRCAGGLLIVMAAAGPPSTPFFGSAPPGVDGGPAPAMTVKARRRSVPSYLRFVSRARRAIRIVTRIGDFLAVADVSHSPPVPCSGRNGLAGPGRDGCVRSKPGRTDDRQTVRSVADDFMRRSFRKRSIGVWPRGLAAGHEPPNDASLSGVSGNDLYRPYSVCRWLFVLIGHGQRSSKPHGTAAVPGERRQLRPSGGGVRRRRRCGQAGVVLAGSPWSSTRRCGTDRRGSRGRLQRVGGCTELPLGAPDVIGEMTRLGRACTSSGCARP